MSVDLELDPSDPTPLWSQLAQRLRELVASGQLPPGAPVPSVRVLARQLTLNPGTVAKALQTLVADGVLVVRRGEGTFVAPSPPKLTPQERASALKAAARPLAVTARNLGASLEEATHALSEAWQDLEKPRGAQ
ncbi:MAG: GntR family transcriptional regulator [Thermoanaerobaculum sp.]